MAVARVNYMWITTMLQRQFQPQWILIPGRLVNYAAPVLCENIRIGTEVQQSLVAFQIVGVITSQQRSDILATSGINVTPLGN
jgi:hypothetical protein